MKVVGCDALVSLKGFLESSVRSIDRSIEKLKYGKALRDKLNIISWVALSRIPNFVRQNLLQLDEMVQYLLSMLTKRTIATVNGIKFELVEIADIGIISHQFERWMWNYLEVKKGEVFLDIGAHIGKYTLPIAKTVGESGLVIAVEPHPRNYNTLLRNIRRNEFQNVIALKIAAWNDNCELDLFQSRGSAEHSLKKLLQEQQGHASEKPPLKVQAKRLDDVLEKVGVKVDWIKIDAEGAEIEVVQGLEKTLKRDRPRLIVESWRTKQQKLRKLIEKLGFKVETMPNPTYFFCSYEVSKR